MQGEVGWKAEVLKTPFQGTFGNSTSTQGTEQSLRKGGFDRLPERIGWGRWCGVARSVRGMDMSPLAAPFWPFTEFGGLRL